MRKTIKQLEKENEIYRNALERIKDIENNHLVRKRFEKEGCMNYPFATGVIMSIAEHAIKEGSFCV